MPQSQGKTDGLVDLRPASLLIDVENCFMAYRGGLDRVHRILPPSPRERIRRIPIAIKDTLDCENIQKIDVDVSRDFVLKKRRDSAFLGTESAFTFELPQGNTYL